MLFALNMPRSKHNSLLCEKLQAVGLAAGVVLTPLRELGNDTAFVDHCLDLDKALLELLAKKVLGDFLLLIFGVCVVAQQEEVVVDAVKHLLEALDNEIFVRLEKLVESCLHAVVDFRPDSVNLRDFVVDESTALCRCTAFLE